MKNSTITATVETVQGIICVEAQLVKSSPASFGVSEKGEDVHQEATETVLHLCKDQINNSIVWAFTDNETGVMFIETCEPVTEEQLLMIEIATGETNRSKWFLQTAIECTEIPF